jgi:hypothetical protein
VIPAPSGSRLGTRVPVGAERALRAPEYLGRRFHGTTAPGPSRYGGPGRIARVSPATNESCGTPHLEIELHFYHSGIAFTVMAEHQGW